MKDPGPGDMGGWETLEGACWSGAPSPPPHLYPLTLAPILCGGFCSHPHLQDLQGSKLGLGTGKLPGQGLSARRQWVCSSGSRTAHRRPLCTLLPAVDGLPGPVSLWLGSESVGPRGSPWETYKPPDIGLIVQCHLSSDQDASALCLSLSCKVRWVNPKNGGPGQSDSLLRVPTPCEHGCFPKKGPAPL